MTEAEWLTCDAPTPMLGGLRKADQDRYLRLSYRKFLLVTILCYRKSLPDPESLLACSVAEIADAFADGQTDHSPIHRLWIEVEQAVVNTSRSYELTLIGTPSDLSETLAHRMIAELHSVSTPGIIDKLRVTRARKAAHHFIRISQARGSAGLAGTRRKLSERRLKLFLANSIRDIFGNLFQPVILNPSWLTSTVVSLAQQMYDTRDFSAMPILADALQDAGCETPDILDHCREPNGVHTRGCWVVDSILGKT